MQMQADNKASLSPETESGGTFPSFPPFFPPPHSFWFCSNEKDIISFSPQSAASALSSSTTALGDRQTKGECIIVARIRLGAPQLRPINHLSWGLRKSTLQIPHWLILIVASKLVCCTLHDPTCKHHPTKTAPVTLFRHWVTKKHSLREMCTFNKSATWYSDHFRVQFVLYYSSNSMGGDYSVIVSSFVCLFIHFLYETSSFLSFKLI